MARHTETETGTGGKSLCLIFIWGLGVWLGCLGCCCCLYKGGSMSLYEMLDQKSKDNLNRVSQAVDKKHAEEFVKNNTLVEVAV